MFKTQNLDVQAGKLIVFSRGEYSDYGYRGAFVALVHITPDMFMEAAEAAKAKAREENDKDSWSEGSEYGADDKFIPELVRRGWLLDVEYREIHTGSYGELDLT